MTFLSNMLREEGGYEYKRAIVNTIITIIEENSEAKEAGKHKEDLKICFDWQDFQSV